MARKRSDFTQLVGKDVWFIYSYMGEMPDGHLVVKIGVTNNPFRRIEQLTVGMPFKAVMLWARVGSNSKTRKLEKELHSHFGGRHMRGEWFLFSPEDKETFHVGTTALYYNATGKALEWNVIEDSSTKGEIKKLIPKDRVDYWSCKHCLAPLENPKAVYCSDECWKMEQFLGVA